jgi:hypothetical protein
MRTGANVRMHRRKVILGAAALVLVGATASTFALGNTGTLSFGSAPTPSGMSSTGHLASFTSLPPGTVSLKPGAQKVSGVLVGKVTVAEGYASKLAVDVSWLDPNNASKALNNPNAWISFELDYPIHAGGCITNTDVATALSITDGSTPLCVRQILMLSPRLRH